MDGCPPVLFGDVAPSPKIRIVDTNYFTTLVTHCVPSV